MKLRDTAFLGLILVALGPTRLPAQETPSDQDAVAILALARETQDAVTFASAVADLVRLSYRNPGVGNELLPLLREFAGSQDQVKRAISVDAVKSLPESLREQMVTVLARLAEQPPGDGPATRLYVRGLAEAGENGRAALRGLLNGGQLSGDAEALARMYLR